MYWITSSRRSCSKSTSMSGGSLRSLEMKRSNSTDMRAGSTSVMPRQKHTAEYAADQLKLVPHHAPDLRGRAAGPAPRHALGRQPPQPGGRRLAGRHQLRGVAPVELVQGEAAALRNPRAGLQQRRGIELRQLYAAAQVALAVRKQPPPQRVQRR